jgi:pre-rRNA-processing protein IPI1
MMAYIFNAMTHLAVDIRIMAFDFLDLTLEFYPLSFSSYAEKVIFSVHIVNILLKYVS